MAQLLVNQKPQLVPYLKPVVQGLAALASQIEKGGGQQPSMPGGSPEGGANAPSGDSAMGAGAMGM